MRGRAPVGVALLISLAALCGCDLNDFRSTQDAISGTVRASAVGNGTTNIYQHQAFLSCISHTTGGTYIKYGNWTNSDTGEGKAGDYFWSYVQCNSGDGRVGNVEFRVRYRTVAPPGLPNPGFTAP